VYDLPWHPGQPGSHARRWNTTLDLGRFTLSGPNFRLRRNRHAIGRQVYSQGPRAGELAALATEKPRRGPKEAEAPELQRLSFRRFRFERIPVPRKVRGGAEEF
jgi:hypothetical protein